MNYQNFEHSPASNQPTDPHFEHSPASNQSTDPRSIIMEIMNEVSVRGGNDSEIPTLQYKLERLNNPACSQKEAARLVKEAREILASKQDYH